MHLPSLTRATVSASLVIGAVLTVVFVLLMPDFSGGHADRLAAIAATPTTSTVSALCFILAQLFLAVGLIGVAHLMRHRVPVLATAGGALAVLGAFGHAVYGGVNLIMLSMATTAAGPTVLDSHATVLDHAEQGVGIPFMAAGLLGTVLGFVVLGAGIWRARLGARWLGPAMIVWVVVEFGLSGLSQWAGYASGLIYAVIFCALAAVVWRSSIGHWQTAAEAAQLDLERVTA